MNSAICVFWSDEDQAWVAIDKARLGCSAVHRNKLKVRRELVHAQAAWDMARASALRQTADKDTGGYMTPEEIAANKSKIGRMLSDMGAKEGKLTTDDLKELLKRLHDFEREVEFGNLPEYIGGGWSRRNFRSLLQDIHSARHTFGQYVDREVK